MQAKQGGLAKEINVHDAQKQCIMPRRQEQFKRYGIPSVLCVQIQVVKSVWIAQTLQSMAVKHIVKLATQTYLDQRGTDMLEELPDL